MNKSTTPAQKRRRLGLLPRLLIGIVAGILIGGVGGLFGIAKTAPYISFIRFIATLTALFSTFLNFIIPLLILAFVAVGLAELGKKANKLFGITLALAYLSTIAAGFISFILGKALLPSFIAHITGGVVKGTEFKVLFAVTVDPVFPIMTALVLAFVLGLAMANTNTPTMMNLMQDFKAIITKVLEGVIIPLIPYYIAGTFAKIAASGELVPTIIMFAKLYAMILALQWAYILVQFTAASLYNKENRWRDLKNIMPAYFTALGTQSSAAALWRPSASSNPCSASLPAWGSSSSRCTCRRIVSAPPATSPAIRPSQRSSTASISVTVKRSLAFPRRPMPDPHKKTGAHSS